MQNPKNPGVALSYTGSNPNDGTWNDQQPEVVRCPICGDTYVHLSARQRIFISAWRTAPIPAPGA